MSFTVRAENFEEVQRVAKEGTDLEQSFHLKFSLYSFMYGLYVTFLCSILFARSPSVCKPPQNRSQEEWKTQYIVLSSWMMILKIYHAWLIIRKLHFMRDKSHFIWDSHSSWIKIGYILELWEYFNKLANVEG